MAMAVMSILMVMMLIHDQLTRRRHVVQHRLHADHLRRHSRSRSMHDLLWAGDLIEAERAKVILVGVDANTVILGERTTGTNVAGCCHCLIDWLAVWLGFVRPSMSSAAI